MSIKNRSSCPVNQAVELIGDRWTLLILRDLMVADRRTFRVLLQKSEEGISSNILAARLKALVAAGMLTTTEDPSHQQRVRYNLTEKAIDLTETIVHLGAWGARHFEEVNEIGGKLFELERRGPEAIREFANRLRAAHLSTASLPRTSSGDA
ncbi:winged helix-turn-helix transcriptional regulator [Kutzneria sp. CA-103260]|uniref:winged helix-turn-helix transcriptional regulator n=1 Tax=Kutzneria sp. CA-103260 TaxID=2802641 RepID=UPI001BEE0370|nr:helix-turn-helix domain-containing protein [Kutzneria sp. CA-103260]QUQ72413.1 HxlR-like helix-turn-helix [Kutzneria sp. CA-103260]